MFDVSWSELLILGLVTLIFVGPKELPRFLGQLGRYAGVVRRHANEFRSVFEQAMREAEMDEIQKQVRAVGDGVKASLDDATRAIEGARAASRVEPEAAAPEQKILAERAAASEDGVWSGEASPAASPAAPESANAASDATPRERAVDAVSGSEDAAPTERP